MERAADCRRQKPGAYPDRSGRAAQTVKGNDRKVPTENTPRIYARHQKASF